MASKKSKSKDQLITIADLKSTVLDIEYLLISVVQGLALAALAATAGDPITKLDFMTWPYILGSFLIILTFWSQAIIHTISFIDWPIDMVHNFLYFLVAFVEVMAFDQITTPLKWFAFFLVFLLLIGLLYCYDLSLIKQKANKFQISDATKALYKHIIKRQYFELLVLLPFGIAYIAMCLVLIYLWPEVFIAKHWHVALVLVYDVVALFSLRDVLNSFKERTRLLTAVTA